MKDITRRLRALAALPDEVAALRARLDEINHVVQLLPAMNQALVQLNHDVHSGSENALPLFQGFAERLRLDADTAIGATQVIERQLAELDARIAALRGDG